LGGKGSSDIENVEAKTVEKRNIKRTAGTKLPGLGGLNKKLQEANELTLVTSRGELTVGEKRK